MRRSSDCNSDNEDYSKDLGSEPPSDKEFIGGGLALVSGAVALAFGYYWKYSSSAPSGKDKASEPPLGPLSSSSNQDNTSTLGDSIDHFLS